MNKVSPLITREVFAQASEKSIRDGFGHALVDMGKKQWDLVALCADLRESLRMQEFAESFPNRFFEMGVAEQNMVGVAAGLANEGLVAVAGSFAAFSPGRTYDQIRVSICYDQKPVVIIGGHAGLTVGEDGATHQMLEDLAMMRALPNMTVAVASDFDSAGALLRQLVATRKPGYLRLSRTKTKNLPGSEALQLGKANPLTEGDDLGIVTCGVMVDRALQLAFDLEDQLGIRATVLNLHTLKPLDESALLNLAQRTGRIVTIEEHQQFGGLGSSVAEYLSQNWPTAMEIIGVRDQFGQSGSADELLDAYGFSRETLLQRVRHFLAR